jgi:hypothetical protein
MSYLVLFYAFFAPLFAVFCCGVRHRQSATLRASSSKARR